MRVVPWLASILLLGACRAPFPGTEAAQNVSARAKIERAAVRLPEAASLRFRALLGMAGAETPLDTRALRRPPGDLRAVGLSDLGGTVFHLVAHTQRGQTRVLRASPEIGGAMVRDGIGPDLSMCLFTAPRQDDQLVRHPKGIGLLRRDGSARTLLWQSSANGPIDRVMRGTRDRLDSEARIEWKDGRPSYVRIENHQFRYTLELWSTGWEAADLTDEHFQWESIR